MLAAKLFGRWRSGASLTLAPVKDDPARGQDPQRNNDFTYADDPDRKQAPLGCHMRRMNPRDTKLPVLTDVNIHRIIRRSTTYGAPYDPNALLDRDDKHRGDSSSCSLAPGRWPPWSSCNASGSMTEISRKLARNVTRSWACRRKVEPSRFPEIPSGTVSTESRRSTCCAGASICSCRASRR